MFVPDWRKTPCHSSISLASSSIAGEMSRLASAKWFMLTIIICAWPSHAISAAQSGDTLTFDIPKQSADLALIAFAEQADRTLLFSFDETKTRTASRLT